MLILDGHADVHRGHYKTAVPSSELAYICGFTLSPCLGFILILGGCALKRFAIFIALLLLSHEPPDLM